LFSLPERERPLELLIREDDRKFTHAFDTVFNTKGIGVTQTPVRTPKANAVAERFVGTVRRECTDWLLIANRRHPRGARRGPTATQERAGAEVPSTCPRAPSACAAR
jgi:putative transposase